MMRRLSMAAVVLASTLFVAEASAERGVLLEPTAIPAKARAALIADVAEARAKKPDAFAAVAAIRAKAAEIDRKRRGRMAPFPSMFRALGPDALLPMLEMIALDAPERGGLSATAWTGLRAGLVEAVGALRSPRAAPVLEAILDGPETDFFVVRATAEALARLGTDAAAKKLVVLSKKKGPKRLAVIAGMGDCRRRVVASALASLLAARPDETTAKYTVGSLGNVGSAWAWRTPSAKPWAKEEAATRSTAARALVDAFVRYRGAVRSRASDALMVVDAPDTPTWIASARAGASAEDRAALDRLAVRFARNPTR